MTPKPAAHTPTPWRVYDGGETFVEDKGKVYGILGPDDKKIVETDGGFYGPSMVDAAFIVRAVNSHFELLKKLRTASTMLESIANLPEVANMGGLRTNCNWLSVEIDEAIAKAEGK